jgi:hypothetical protein
MRFSIDRATRIYEDNDKVCDGAIPSDNKPKYEWEKQDYYIEINTLEELIALVEKEGKIVLEKDSILIYDYYIE